MYMFIQEEPHLAEQSEANEWEPEWSKVYSVYNVYVYENKPSEARLMMNKTERSEAYTILDIGQYNIKRVCSSAKSLEPALRAPNLCDHRRSRWPRKLGLLFAPRCARVLAGAHDVPC